MLPLLLAAGPVTASSLLFSGGTVIGFKKATATTPESLQVIRDGSVLVTDDRIAAIFSGPPPIDKMPKGTEKIDIKNKIISTGFVDTHKHGWQTAFKTIASNTTLGEYFNRYGEFAIEGLFTADDVYYGQLAGIFEALNAGVTTILDHAHHTLTGRAMELRQHPREHPRSRLSQHLDSLRPLPRQLPYRNGR